MGCGFVVINHDNCSHDANCGLTCDQVYWNAAASDPSFVSTSEHYDDFMQVCDQFYWPNGCGGVLSSSSSDMGFLQAVVQSNEVLSSVLIGVVLIISFVIGFNVGSR